MILVFVLCVFNVKLAELKWLGQTSLWQTWLARRWNTRDSKTNKKTQKKNSPRTGLQTGTWNSPEQFGWFGVWFGCCFWGLVWGLVLGMALGLQSVKMAPSSWAWRSSAEDPRNQRTQQWSRWKLWCAHQEEQWEAPVPCGQVEQGRNPEQWWRMSVVCTAAIRNLSTWPKHTETRFCRSVNKREMCQACSAKWLQSIWLRSACQHNDCKNKCPPKLEQQLGGWLQLKVSDLVVRQVVQAQELACCQHPVENEIRWGLAGSSVSVHVLALIKNPRS